MHTLEAIRIIESEIAVAAESYMVSRDDILARTHVSAVVADARQQVMANAHEAGCSSTQIGHVLGRDHTTVLHGIAAHQRGCPSLPVFKSTRAQGGATT